MGLCLQIAWGVKSAHQHEKRMLLGTTVSLAGRLRRGKSDRRNSRKGFTEKL